MHGKFCSERGKPNHFSTVCLSSKEAHRRRGKQSLNTKRDIKRATSKSQTDDSESDKDPELCCIDESVRHLSVGKIKVNKISD